MFPEVVVNSLSEAWRCWTAHLRCSAERMAAFYRKTKTRFPSPRVELTSHVSANGTLKLSCMQVNSDKSKVNHRCSTKPDSSHDSEMKTLRDDSSTARATKTSVSLVCVVRSSTRFCRRCGTLTRVRCSNSVVVPSSKNCHSCVVFVALHGGKICNFVTEGEKKKPPADWCVCVIGKEEHWQQQVLMRVTHWSERWRAVHLNAPWPISWRRSWNSRLDVKSACFVFVALVFFISSWTGSNCKHYNCQSSSCNNLKWDNVPGDLCLFAPSATDWFFFVCPAFLWSSSKAVDLLKHPVWRRRPLDAGLTSGRRPPFHPDSFPTTPPPPFVYFECTKFLL